jgi:Concanavalin A-like lectin/glucanases superfamily
MYAAACKHCCSCNMFSCAVAFHVSLCALAHACSYVYTIQTLLNNNSGQAVPEAAWTHIAVVFQADTTLMYMNGALVLDQASRNVRLVKYVTCL